MDFCDDLHNVQNIFNYCNDYIKPLNKIIYYGGNEPFIVEIIARLLRYLKSQNYILQNFELNTQHDDKLRKITYYMILNTDVTMKYDLSKDQRICHLLNTIPQLTPCILINVIWGANLNKYFYEFLSYAPSYYVAQFLEKTIESLRHAKPYELLERVEELLKALYLNICRLDYNINSKNNSLVDKKIVLNKLQDSFLNLIRHFNTPDADKFSNWSNQKKDKYCGYLLKHLFSLIIYCFKLFKNRPPLELEEKLNVYLLMREFENLFDNHSSMYSDTINSFLITINNSFLNALQNNVMAVTIITFMEWVEFDLVVVGMDGDHVEQSLQQTVGEMAYYLTELVNTNECFQHDVEAQLKSISIKPKTDQEKIESVTLGDIMLKLDNLPSTNIEKRSLWLNGLLKHDSIFGNLECLTTVSNNVDIIKVEELKILILNEHIKLEPDSQMDDDDENEEMEKLKEIIFHVVQTNLNADELIDVILYVIQIAGENYVKYHSPENIRSMNNQFLNRITSDEIDSGRELICLKLIFNSPKLFYEDLFQHLYTLNILKTAQHYNNFALNIVTISKRIFKFYMFTFLNDIVVDDNTEVEFFDSFLSSLFMADIITKVEFLKEILYKHIMYCLRTKKYKMLLMLMKTANAVTNAMPSGFHSPMLLTYATIIDELRWKLDTFKNIKVTIIETTITAINNLLRIYLPNASVEDKNWIWNKISGMQHITKYYFQKLLLNRTDTIKLFDQFMIQQEEKFTSDRSYLMFLFKMFQTCTKKEIEWLAKNTDLVRYFTKALLITTISIVKSEKHDSGLIEQCFTNYIAIFDAHIASLPTLKADQLNLYYDIIHIIGCAPAPLHENLMNIFYQKLSEYLKKIFNANKGEYTTVELEKIKKVTLDLNAQTLANNLIDSIEM